MHPRKKWGGGCCGGSCPRASPPWCPPTSSLSTLSSSPRAGAPQGFKCFGHWMLKYVPCLCISPSFRHPPGLMGASYRLFPIPGKGIGWVKFDCDKTGTQKTYHIFTQFFEDFYQMFTSFPLIAPLPMVPRTWPEKVYKKSPILKDLCQFFDTSKFPAKKLSHKYSPPGTTDPLSVPRGSRSMAEFALPPKVLQPTASQTLTTGPRLPRVTGPSPPTEVVSLSDRICYPKCRASQFPMSSIICIRNLETLKIRG